MQECYKKIGAGGITSRHATNFYGDLREAIEPLIIAGGFAISCGWNSIGMGKTHGFQIIEVLLVCHGRSQRVDGMNTDIRDEVKKALDAACLESKPNIATIDYIDCKGVRTIIRDGGVNIKGNPSCWQCHHNDELAAMIAEIKDKEMQRK